MAARKVVQGTGSELAEQFGRILVEARGERSLRGLANELGLSRATLSELEKGEANPTLAYIEAMAERYGVKVAMVVVVRV
jgi:transcriptional regulator with XRE-family HTH domain